MVEISSMGYDNGYDFIKVVANINGNILKDKFFSLTYQIPEDSVTDKVSNYKFSKDKMQIEYNGVQYAIGDIVFNLDPNQGTKNFSNDKFREPSERVKLIAAVALLTDDEEVLIKNLCVGLNIENYAEYRDKFKELYSGKTLEYKLLGEKTTRVIEIENVKCVPQGYGAYVYLKKEELLEDEGWVGIIDIGGRTVDSFIIDNELYEPIPGTAIGLDEGTSNAFKRVATKIGLNELHYNKIEKAYYDNKSKVTVNGEKKSINICKKEFNILGETIANQISNKWVKYRTHMSESILCGGGGIDLEDSINEHLDLKVVLGDEPQFGNALGYEYIARQKE